MLCGLKLKVRSWHVGQEHLHGVRQKDRVTALIIWSITSNKIWCHLNVRVRSCGMLACLAIMKRAIPSSILRCNLNVSVLKVSVQSQHVSYEYLHVVLPKDMMTAMMDPTISSNMVWCYLNKFVVSEKCLKKYYRLQSEFWLILWVYSIRQIDLHLAFTY